MLLSTGVVAAAPLVMAAGKVNAAVVATDSQPDPNSQRFALDSKDLEVGTEQSKPLYSYYMDMDIALMYPVPLSVLEI